MNIQVGSVTLGFILALIALLLCVVAMFIGRLDWMTGGLIALVAAARLC